MDYELVHCYLDEVRMKKGLLRVYKHQSLTLKLGIEDQV
jgi:hypothetical protein